METEIIKSQSAFITKDVLEETQEKLKKELLMNQKEVKEELSKRLDKGDSNMDKIEDKVDHLTTIVLPLLVATEATAKNTERMVVAFDKFAERQITTNENLNNRVSAQDVTIEGLKYISGGVTEKKKNNALIVSAAATVVVAIVTGIFQFAPVIVPFIFK